MSKFYEKFGRSFSKIIFPLLFKLFSSLRINRRAINYFSEKGYFLNNKQNFYSLISNLLNQKKIITLDVGAQGGFNSDEFILNKYNSFFEPILVEPIKEEAEQLKKIINMLSTMHCGALKQKKKFLYLETDLVVRRCMNQIQIFLTFIK